MTKMTSRDLSGWDEDFSTADNQSSAPETTASSTTHERLSISKDHLHRVVTFDDEEEEQEEDSSDTTTSGLFNAIVANRESWMLEDFSILGKLGEGGAATVFEAREVQSGHHVALKVQNADDGQAIIENYIHGSLSPHENVVQFYDHFYAHASLDPETTCDDDKCASPSQQKVYSILELCQKGSLLNVVRQFPQGRVKDESQAAVWAKSALLALQHVHSHGILHGDVKTANFVVTQNNTLKLADFGFAVRQEDLEEDDQVEGGSLLYMAPEQLLVGRDGGSMDQLDAAIDVYGLGVVLFEILVGELPYAILEEYDDTMDHDENIQDFADCWEGVEFAPQILDLPALCKESLALFPTPLFPDFVVSEEAQDLVQSLLQPDPKQRISIEQALCHPWIQSHDFCAGK